MFRKWLLNESSNQQYLRIQAPVSLFFNPVYILLGDKLKKRIHSIFPFKLSLSFLPQIKIAPLAALPHLPTCFCGWRGHHWLPGKELLPHFLLQLPVAVSNFLGESGHIHSCICITMRSSSIAHHTLTAPPPFTTDKPAPKEGST